MAYFKIGGIDFSPYVNQLVINDNATYTAQTNAAGDTVVDYVNRKRKITVGIIPVDGETMARLMNAVNAFNVSLSFRNPKTNALEENVSCIIPADKIEYYTIQGDKAQYKALTLDFTEL